jgi:serine O-acetyltransferase
LLYFPVARGRLKHYRYRLGIGIPCTTRIGPGLFIGHFGAIVVNELAELGSNVNLSQQITIGQVNRGSRIGVPTIGHHVYIAPGAKIVGNVKVGNRVAIGANAVVTKDVENDAVVGGVPARVLSHDGVEGYVDNTDYTGEWWFTRAFPIAPTHLRDWQRTSRKQGT